MVATTADGASLVWQAVADPDALWRLKPAWDALWRAADGDHVQTERACFHAWHNDPDPSPRRLHAIAGWRDGRLVFLWPLVIRRRHGLWNMVSQLGPQAGELTSVLVETNPSAVAWTAAAWDFLQETGRGDIVWLDYIKVGSPLHRVLTADPGRFSGAGAKPDVAPFLHWPEAMKWDEYYASLSSHSRKLQVKKHKGLAKTGDVTFEALSEPARRAFLADWILQHKRHWAGRTGKNGPWLTSATYHRFLCDLSGDPAATDCIVFTLSVNGEVIAALLTSMGTQHIDWIIAAYDPAWGHHSPGLLLNEYCLRWALERSLSVEFGRGYENNKRLWSRGACHDVLSYRVSITRRGAMIDAVRKGLSRARPDRLLKLIPRGRRGAPTPLSPDTTPA